MTKQEIKELQNGALIDDDFVGYRYEIRHQQHHRFRDRVTIYYDGKLFFERYCYGESAGLTGSCWATGIDDNGCPQWVTENVPKVVTDALPAKLEAIDTETLQFSGSQDIWDCNAKLKRDNGYSLFKRKLGVVLGKK